MGSSSFSPGNNRRSPKRHKWEIWLYRQPLGYNTKFSSQPWVVSQASPHPKTSRFFCGPDLRMHAAIDRIHAGRTWM